MEKKKRIYVNESFKVVTDNLFSRLTFERLLLHQTKSRGLLEVCYNYGPPYQRFFLPDALWQNFE